MRLWHQKIIPYLPRQQLLGQHRECCALRGAGWGRNHSVVNYVFEHDPVSLISYHYLIMNEMEHRGYHPDKTWKLTNYRGSTLGYTDEPKWHCGNAIVDYLMCVEAGAMIYPEHNDEYLQECLDNLKGKGICIDLN